jgi:hypothetical protein
MALVTCPKLAQCPFFHDRLKGMPAIAEMMTSSPIKPSEWRPFSTATEPR